MATLTLHEAAEQLGVHYMTVYRYVRTGRLEGRKLGGTWVIDARALQRSMSPRSARRGAPARSSVVAALADRLIQADEPGAWAIVEGALAGGAEPTQLHLDVLGPALREVGERWERNVIDVADEHAATVVMQRLIGRLGPVFRHRGRPRGTVVVGTP